MYVTLWRPSQTMARRRGQLARLSNSSLGGKQFAIDVFVLARGGLEHDVVPERRIRERTSTIG
jgi:hypothetical protein